MIIVFVKSRNQVTLVKYPTNGVTNLVVAIDQKLAVVYGEMLFTVLICQNILINFQFLNLKKKLPMVNISAVLSMVPVPKLLMIYLLFKTIKKIHKKDAMLSVIQTTLLSPL